MDILGIFLGFFFEELKNEELNWNWKSKLIVIN